MECFDARFPIFYLEKENMNDEIENLKATRYESGDYFIFINPLCRKTIFDGKIGTIKELCEPNFKFLQHMFRFNKTLTSFSNIVKKGYFNVSEQYNEKEVWKYFKECTNFFTEKKGKYIGHMETKSNLDYFPTNHEIQYKALPYLFKIELKSQDFIRKSTINFIKKHIELECYDIVICVSNESCIYEGLIKIGRYDLIDECFKASFHIRETDKIVIADLFAGEGEWLNLFKRIADNRKIYTIANEIEQNRYNECKNKKFSNVIYGAYEDLYDKIPKNFIDIMLFNPPYGDTDGVRNVKRFFEMLYKDNYLETENRLVMVINKKDFEECIVEILEHTNYLYYAFEINNGNESDRLKQVCLILELHTNGRKSNGHYLQNMKYYLNDYLSTKYKMSRVHIQFYGKNINSRFDNFNVKKNPDLYKSNIESDNWKNLINDVTIETFQGKTIKLAERPRNIGAAANLISSGLINGEIEGEHEHCIAAGITESTIKTIDIETGNVIVTKQSAPFLSVLTGGNIVQIASGGKDNVEIKEDGTVVVV